MEDEVQIILLRHGEAERNVNQVDVTRIGERQSKLTKTGKEQA